MPRCLPPKRSPSHAQRNSLLRGRFRAGLETLERRDLLTLTINPTFASNIISDPNAAAIEATINRTIAAYQNLITDNVTVDITFQEGGGLGGSSGGLGYNIKYADYRSALDSHKTTANDTTALGSLPNTTNDPVNNNERIFVRSPLARALGFSAPSAGGAAGDGTITLNTSICNLDRTSAQDSTKYDLQAVTAHEIDEILGFGSSLDASNNGVAVPTGNIKPDDLFRYDQNGARSYSSTATDQAYFSIDGGTTQLARFNQTHTAANAGDYGDWYSFFGGQTPQVQDAFNTPNARANLNVEMTRLDILGYSLALHGPTVTAAANQSAVEESSKSFDLGSFTDPDAAPWGIAVSWGDGSPDTTFYVNSAGALGSKSHAYAEEGNYTVKVTVTDFTSQSQSQTFQASVSDPPVSATGGQSLKAVEGTSSGSLLLATFTDPGGPEPLGDYSADVDWGDGSGVQIGAGVISFASGHFEVRGAHTYAEESASDHPGSSPYQVSITIHHESTTPQTVTSSVTVDDPSVVGAGVAINAVEGLNTGSILVATFTDPGGVEALSDYSADIDWGDGTASAAGAITLNGSTFEVRGSHSYAEESATDHPGSNPYQISVTVHHESALPTVIASTATVSDPAVLPTGGFLFTAVEGAPSATQTSATFTDPGGAEPLGDYSASIDWGDGTPASAGTISVSGGVYTVKASHTYAVGLGLPDDFGNSFCDGTPPHYHKAITVSVSHESAPLAQAVSSADISVAPGTAHLAGGSLIVVATAADDKVLINKAGNTGAVEVKLNSNKLGSFTLGSGGRIIVAGMSGNDDIQIAGGVTNGAVLYGGPGNDRIKAGDGPSILVGCEGDDELLGSAAVGLLIGGRGADRLVAGAGNDILVAADIVNPVTLAEDVQYSHLVAALSGGPITANNDADVDKLTGAAGVDKFFYNFTGNLAFDIVTDKAELAFDV